VTVVVLTTTVHKGQKVQVVFRQKQARCHTYSQERHCKNHTAAGTRPATAATLLLHIISVVDTTTTTAILLPTCTIGSWLCGHFDVIHAVTSGEEGCLL
jgi:hypothetical protein